MDVSRRKTKELNDSLNVTKKSEKKELLNRRREINARYSRLLLSKTIQHFTNQGHLSIRISEKLNDKKGHSHYTDAMKVTSQFEQKRNKTMSFWQLPRTLKCEFEITNTSRGLKNVTTQTNFAKCNEENENSWYTSEPSNNSFGKNISVCSEILSSKRSCEGNIMSLVMRTKHGDNLNDQNEISQSANNIASSPRTPRRKYKTFRNAERSKNFWATYNNFILCNRSIELRITKLYSVRNVQYIVAFSENFFEECNDRGVLSLMKKKSCNVSCESCYVVQYIKFNIGACIFEYCSVEHVIELTVILEFEDNNTDIVQGIKFGARDFIENIIDPVEFHMNDESKIPFESKEELHKKHLKKFSANSSLMNSETINPISEAEGKVNDLQKDVFSLDRHKTVTMKILCVVVSFWVVYIFRMSYLC